MQPMNSIGAQLDHTEMPIGNPNACSIDCKIVRNLFPADVFSSTLVKLASFIDKWKQRYSKKTEVVLLHNKIDSSREYSHIWEPSQFKIVTFSKKHKIVDLKAFESLFPQDPLYAILKDIIEIAVERFAEEEKLEGDHRLRIHFKAFVLNHSDSYPEEKEESLSLGWHYDFCGKSTLSIPLLSDFSQSLGSLLFARNEFKGKCSGKHGDNCAQAKPIENTITSISYPVNGGLLFPGNQGRQIHKPCTVTFPPHTTGTLTRCLLQIVLFDKDWMDK